MCRPDFRGHEHLAAPDTRGAQAFADRGLVVVDLGGIDVPVAKPQRLFDHARAGAAAQVPGAEPEQRDAGAVGRRHGEALLLPASACVGHPNMVLHERAAEPIAGRRLLENIMRSAKSQCASGFNCRQSHYCTWTPAAPRVAAQRGLPLNTAKAACGARSMTLSSARAGPRGDRLPCSQLRTVSTGTPIRSAKAVCVNPVRPRTSRA